MAAARFAGGLWQTTAQETLTIEYTLEGVEGVRHELLVDADEEFLKFENIPLTSLILPEGLTKLRELKVDFGFRGGNMTNLTLPEDLRSLRKLDLWYCGLTDLTLPKGLMQVNWLSIPEARDIPFLTSLNLPEDFGKYALGKYADRIVLLLMPSIERLSVHKNMKEFRLVRYFVHDEFDFPSARELIRNRKPDSDGVFRIQSRPSTIAGARIVVGSDGVYRIETRHPLLVEVYGFQPTFTITRKADGVEIGWEAGILQRSLLIDGPWQDVESGGTERRLFLRPSHPYEFFRIKP